MNDAKIVICVACSALAIVLTFWASQDGVSSERADRVLWLAAIFALLAIAWRPA
jgi:hypothetical protein